MYTHIPACVYIYMHIHVEMIFISIDIRAHTSMRLPSSPGLEVCRFTQREQAAVQRRGPKLRCSTEEDARKPSETEKTQVQHGS